MTVTRELFGALASGESVDRYTLENGSGASVSILNMGCIIQSIRVPDSRGQLVDVCLGFDTPAEYAASRGCFGAVVGRCANRIRDGVFSIDGTAYYLTLNYHGHHIHGGATGFDRRMWRAESRDGALRLSLVSPDGEEGYPGRLRVQVEYAFGDDNALTISYRAETDAPTIVNLTNHSYFNLNGHGSGSAMDHTLCLRAGEICANGPDGMPDGTFVPVEGTPFDFRCAKRLGEDIDVPHPQTAATGGYDHNYVLDSAANGPQAVLTGDKSGIRMSMTTDQPGVQLYTANSMKPVRGKGGAGYGARGAVCLETQHFPNTPANPAFPSIVLRPGQVFASKTVYAFGTV